MKKKAKQVRTIDDVLHPAHAESKGAAQRMVLCDHALAIIDQQLALLNAQLEGDGDA
jgi:hypothetical protein